MGQPIVRYESGQTSYAFEEMTDSGDNTTFSASFSPLSRVSGFAPTIAPYGLLTGGAITTHATNDTVSVAAMTLMAPGMTGADDDGVVSVSADTVTISRGVTTDTHRITSITVASDGSITAVAGVDNAGSFSETRGADGGPPYIPVGSIEIGQVRTTSITAAAVLSTEIKQVPGTHLERSDSPTYTVDYANGQVTFNEALPTIHTGDLPKKVYIDGATPIFAPIGYVSDWSPAKETRSVSSEDTYDGAVATSSASLSQATFTARLDNGITDPVVTVEGEEVWIEYRPDRDASIPKQLTQGVLNSTWSQQAGGGKVSASYTVSASTATVNVTS